MRWIFVLGILLAAAWYLRSCEDPPPRPAEETFIGDQVKALREAENFEQEYLDATRKKQEEIDKELEDQDEDQDGG